MIEINYLQLEPDTLNNLLKEIALREGTEYGEAEVSTEDKVNQLKLALQTGRAMIMYDVDYDFCDVVSKSHV